MEQILNLSSLNIFLHQILAFTEEVKYVLQSDCEEAMFSLKPWRKKHVVKLKNNESCTSTKSENEIEEIAAGISRTLLQTQQLREKLSHNVMKRKKCLNQPSTSEIYNPCASGDEKGNKDNTSARSNSKLLPVKETTKKTKSCTKPPTTQSEKYIKNKNFLAINKQNIKNIKEIKRHSDYKLEKNFKSSSFKTKAEYVKFDKKCNAASTNELKNLIEKVSFPSFNNEFSNVDDEKCPIHEDLTSQVTYKQNFISVDVMDSLKEFNIPGEIIKPLNAYHTYLNTEFSDKSFDSGKRRKVLNIFFIEFNKMDDIIQNTLEDKTDKIALLKHFISQFPNFFLENKETSALININKIYTELNFIWKKYDTTKFNNFRTWKPDVERKLLHNDSNIIRCMSNGIWNFFYARYFEGISTVRYIHYANKNQFFETMQELQQVHYYKDIVNIISKEILPNVTISFDSAKPEYVKIYKMIYILLQGLNSRIPVLVRTDK
nr:uncharacterized protein LOC116426230 [Nomia melanderi]